MKRSFILALFLLAVSVFIGAPQVGAEVKITVKNNRPHTLSIAFCWARMDDYQYKGWYNVKAGETRTIAFKDAISAFTMSEFGFYAKGTNQSGKTVTWGGDKAKDRLGWVVPGQAFTFIGSPESPPRGGKGVYFRNVKLRKVGNDNTDAVGALTFNP